MKILGREKIHGESQFWKFVFVGSYWKLDKHAYYIFSAKQWPKNFHELCRN